MPPIGALCLAVLALLSFRLVGRECGHTAEVCNRVCFTARLVQNNLLFTDGQFWAHDFSTFCLCFPIRKTTKMR